MLALPLPEPKPKPKPPEMPPTPTRVAPVADPPTVLELVSVVLTMPGPGTRTEDACALPVEALPPIANDDEMPPLGGAIAALPAPVVELDEADADCARAGVAVSAITAPAMRNMDLRMICSPFSQNVREKGRAQPCSQDGNIAPVDGSNADTVHVSDNSLLAGIRGQYRY